MAATLVRRLVLAICAVVSVAGPACAIDATPASGDAPVPISFPPDDGPHGNAGIEWWYFTGHLISASGERYGFEYVVFRARPGGLEGYAAHFAITDDTRADFRYAQRIFGANEVTANSSALDLQLADWTMSGGNGIFSLYATMPDYALDVDLATTRPAALHDGDGYIDYGNGTATYYYSWTRLRVQGTLTTSAGEMTVDGTAWMDHQWGDFLTYQDGGWDWFAVQLDNGVDIMVYVVRAGDGSLLRVDGTIVGPSGDVTTLQRGEFTVRATGEWRSPHTDTIYPSGWEIAIPEEAITLTVTPTVLDQELDTRPTTGVIYWEGESTVSATINGQIIDGRGTVELTGYAPYAPPTLPSQATPTP